MMLCVSSVNYSALVNFEKVGPINPGRGLRQGDPLSPYLFIMVAEGLTSLINKAVACGDLHGVKICRGAPTVSHLLFADDCFLFCRSNLSETRKLMEILKTYEEASGQEINLSKSEVFFSRNISRAAQADLSNLMGVRHVLGTGTYLGMPSMVGRSKKATFAYIKDRIWRKINSWRSRPISKAGKEIMIKSILQAIPTYVMSIYLIPDATVNEIEKMLNSFWWGGGHNNKGIKWLSWERMTYPKNKGGLGFRDLKAFNMAMVAKQGWHIMMNPDTLVARIFKARYFPHSSFLAANLGNNPSYVWRCLWKSRCVLNLGCRWRVGDGSTIKVMSDPWLKGEGNGWVHAPQKQGVYDFTVKDLMLDGVKKWDQNKIMQMFSIDAAKEILEVPLLDLVEEDGLVWKEENSGKYTVRTGYRLLMRQKKEIHSWNATADWNSVWRIKAPPRAKHLLWRICRDCLPTRTRLRQHYVPCPSICQLCLNEDEDVWHVLFDCIESRQCWTTAGLQAVVEPRTQNFNDAATLIHDICSHEDKDVAGRCAVMIWTLWNNRNNWLWNNQKMSASNLGMQAFQLWNEWFIANDFHQENMNNQALQQQVWQQPIYGWLKCNVDAGFNHQRRATNRGWCIRNHAGSFISAGTAWDYGHYSILEAEALALLEGMQAATSQNLETVIFECDSQSVVNAVHAQSGGNSEFSIIISSIKNLLNLHSNFEVKFVRRQANLVAHLLAKAANSWSRRNVFYTIPHCIENTLLIEMN
jgi:ribonuclease HI